MDYSKIKLIFFDVDGVIAKDFFTATSADVLKALSELNLKFHVSLCTGRSYKSSSEIILGANLKNRYHVLESGTIVTKPGGDIAYRKSITRDEANLIIDTAGETTREVGVGICVDGIWFDSMEETDGKDISIISLNSKDKNGTDRILNKISSLSESYNISNLASSFYPEGSHIHVTPINISKGYGARFVQNELGLSKGETMGFGDSFGDLPFLEECGVKVVMGNADDDVKSHADIVTDSFDNKGLVKFTNEFLL